MFWPWWRSFNFCLRNVDINNALIQSAWFWTYEISPLSGAICNDSPFLGFAGAKNVRNWLCSCLHAMGRNCFKVEFRIATLSFLLVGNATCLPKYVARGPNFVWHLMLAKREIPFKKWFVCARKGFFWLISNWAKFVCRHGGQKCDHGDKVGKRELESRSKRHCIMSFWKCLNFGAKFRLINRRCSSTMIGGRTWGIMQVVVGNGILVWNMLLTCPAPAFGRSKLVEQFTLAFFCGKSNMCKSSCWKTHQSSCIFLQHYISSEISFSRFLMVLVLSNGTPPCNIVASAVFLLIVGGLHLWVCRFRFLFSICIWCVFLIQRGQC